MDYKKFLVFVVILIAALSIGMTAYYFLKDDEVIVIKNTSVYANVGETFNIDIERREKKSQTKVSFYIQDTSIISQEKSGEFVALSAGQTEVILVTNKERIETQKCIVYVGDGSSENPFFIDKAAEFAGIGTEAYPTFTSDKNYKLINDLDFSAVQNFTPINNFTGTIDGNGYAINNVTYSASEAVESAGIFNTIGANGLVKNLTLNNVNISGQIGYAGVVAGINAGTIECVAINASNVTSSAVGALIGGVAGSNNSGKIDRVATNVNLTAQNEANIGGLVGSNLNAKIVNSYFKGTLTNENHDGLGAGLVAINTASSTNIASIEKCYAVSTYNMPNADKYGLVADNNDGTGEPNNLLGLYYDSTIAGENVNIQPTGSNSNHILDALTTEEFADQLNYVYYITPAPAQTHYWNFEIIWSLNVGDNQTYPTLLMAGNEVEIIPVFDANVITTASQLQNIAMDGSYKLGNDIDLSSISNWTALGTKEIPFTGVLDGQGYKIKNLNLQSAANENGLFGYIGKDASISNIVIEGVNITRGTTIGALAAVNDGSIDNVKVLRSDNLYQINQTVTEGDLIVGAVVGINNGTINNAETNIDITLNGSSEQTATATIGGIVGKNTSVVNNSNSSAYIVSTINKAIIGGVVGNTTSKVSNAYFKGTIFASQEAKDTYVGGIIGYNLDGEVTKIGTKANITGYNAGGLIGYMNKGTMTESFVLSGTTITGYKAGGLLSSLERGEVTNCYTQAKLQGSASGAMKAGFSVYVLGYTNYKSEGSYAIMSKCFSAVTFDNVGKNYTETYSNVRVSLAGSNAMKEAGFIYDSIYDSTLAKGATTQLGSGNFWGSGNNKGYNYGKYYDNMDGRNSTDNCKKVSTFTNRGFSSEVWNLVDGSYPTLVSQNTTYLNS